MMCPQVRDILTFGVADHMGARVELEELAMKALTYSLASCVELAEIKEEARPAAPLRLPFSWLG